MRAEFGRCQRQADVILAAVLAATDPAGADLDGLGDDTKVRMAVGDLVARGQPYAVG